MKFTEKTIRIDVETGIQPMTQTHTHRYMKKKQNKTGSTEIFFDPTKIKKKKMMNKKKSRSDHIKANKMASSILDVDDDDDE